MTDHVRAAFGAAILSGLLFISLNQITIIGILRDVRLDIARQTEIMDQPVDDMLFWDEDEPRERIANGLTRPGRPKGKARDRRAEEGSPASEGPAEETKDSVEWDLTDSKFAYGEGHCPHGPINRWCFTYTAWAPKGLEE